MSKVLVLGAGASYGSDNVGTPPLGADLATALCNFNPQGWGALPQDLLNEFEDDFEQGMVSASVNHSHAIPVLQRAMAAYFFTFLPRTTNLYVRLAELMINGTWGGSICTLNYERYTELCLIHVGLQPVVGQATNAGTSVEICYPHGCCHFFCESVRGTAQGVSFSGMNVQTNGPIRVIVDQNEYQQRINNDAFPPVMSYFEPQKATTSGANFIEGQRQRFSELVGCAKTVVVVGIRVRPHDGHIWGPLKDSAARIVYCGGNTAGNEFADWSNAERPGSNDLDLGGYFGDKFDDIVEELDI